MNILDALKKMKAGETFIWTRKRVDPLTTALAWKAYDKGFAVVNTQTPCRQSFHADEFRQVMWDSDFTKIFLYIQGKPVGLAIMTLALDKLPWISDAYFASAFPGKRVVYVPTIVVAEEFRGDQRSGLLMEELYRIYTEWSCDFLGMDHSAGVNAFLPKLILRYFNGRVVAGETLDSQSYVTFMRFDQR